MKFSSYNFPCFIKIKCKGCYNMNFSKFKEDMKGKKIAIIGFGVSNKPLIKYLSSLGAIISVFDKRSRETLESEIREFENYNLNFILGDSYLDNISNMEFEIVYRSPSMLPTNSILEKLTLEGVLVTSEMDEFFKYCPATVYGITGSDGKTTTTSIVGELLKKEGYKIFVGGNIGMPLFSKLDEIKKEDKVVIELSSFQLMSFTKSPEKALITNLSENHLDIHSNMKEYIDAKKRIYQYQKESDLLVLNAENKLLMEESKDAISNKKFFSSKIEIKNGAYYKDSAIFLNKQKIIDTSKMNIKGIHNIENFMAAILLVEKEVSIETMNFVAKEFKGVEHRCEFVRDIDNIKYFNDSIASSPTRTMATLKSFDKPVILIAGGYDKNLSYELLAEKGFNNIKKLILLGDTKEKIYLEFQKQIDGRNEKKEIYVVNSLKEAVYKSKEIATEKDVVILSPASASFDMFKNFEERGKSFKNIVNSL